MSSVTSVVCERIDWLIAAEIWGFDNEYYGVNSVHTVHTAQTLINVNILHSVYTVHTVHTALNRYTIHISNTLHTVHTVRNVDTVHNIVYIFDGMNHV